MRPTVDLQGNFPPKGYLSCRIVLLRPSFDKESINRWVIERASLVRGETAMPLSPSTVKVFDSLLPVIFLTYPMSPQDWKAVAVVWE